MTKAAIRKGIRALPVADKVELLDELVHLVAADQRDIPLPSWQKKMLDRRLAKYEADPSNVMTYEDFRKKLRGTINRYQASAKKRQANAS